MHFKYFWLCLLLALPSEARAEETNPAAASRADPSPTGFSCTAETLLSDEECVFESEAGPVSDATAAQAVANERLAAEIANKACRASARVGAELRPDEALLAICTEDAKAAVETCGIEGRYPLLDKEGRFAPQADGCYLALADTLRRTRFMASVTAPCCRCAVAAKCVSSAPACNRDLASPEPRLPRCAQEACQSACSVFVTSPEEKPEPAPPAPRPGSNLKYL